MKKKLLLGLGLVALAAVTIREWLKWDLLEDWDESDGWFVGS